MLQNFLSTPEVGFLFRHIRSVFAETSFSGKGREQLPVQFLTYFQQVNVQTFFEGVTAFMLESLIDILL
jgi:hypothetical protein